MPDVHFVEDPDGLDPVTARELRWRVVEPVTRWARTIRAELHVA